MDLLEIQNKSQAICELATRIITLVRVENIIELSEESHRLQKSAVELVNLSHSTGKLQTPTAADLRTLRHDLRNLLGAITGYNEMIAEDCDDNQLIQQYCQQLMAMTKSTLEVVEKSAVQQASIGLVESRTNESPLFTTPIAAGNLLVIDDNENNRDILNHYLVKLGHQVKSVASAKEALLALQQANFDLILLDLIMPEIDGFQLLKQLKAENAWRAIPVIMVSGIDDTEGVIQCIKAGAEDYLTKPFNPVLLEARLSACLERKRWHDREISYLDELEKRNRFIRQAFGQYLTDEIVNSLLENPDGLDLGGAYRKVTIIMTDIRNFTALCEQMSPDRVVKMLNNYLGVMTKIIMEYRGTVDEFIGDAILALFGAPIQRDDDTDRAIACAVKMQLAMHEVNQLNQTDGLPEITMGIGINTGEVIAGNIGSDKRLKYAVVGRHVNLTARIENLTAGGQILASHYTVDAATTPLVIGQTDSVQLKGISEKVQIHEIKGIGGVYNLHLLNKTH